MLAAAAVLPSNIYGFPKGYKNSEDRISEMDKLECIG